MRTLYKVLALAMLLTGTIAFALTRSGAEPGAASGRSAAQSPSRVATTNASPVVLELFTSQGCSSCPPADAVAARLAKRHDVVVISRPVTYWDRLGWKDTLASPVNTELQRAYAKRGLAGNNGVYTPQAVIDGRSGAIGSRERDLQALIASAAKRARPTLSMQKDGAVVVSGPADMSARLALIGLDSSESVAIGSGENGRRRITYTNIYKGEADLGVWNGGRQTFAISPAKRRIAGADRLAVLLREGKTGAILAARML